MRSKLWHIIFLSLGWLCMQQVAYSQPYFNRLLKEVTTFSTILVTDTGYIVAGRGFENLYRTSYLYACNEQGDSLWLTHLSNPPMASAAQRVLAADSVFYVAGIIADTADVTPWDFYLAYFTPSGDNVWLKRYGEPETIEFLEEAIMTKEGDIVMVGLKRIESGDRNAWYVVKTDANGTLLWEKKIDGIENENACRSLIETPEGDYVLVGEQEIAPGKYDLWIIKLNPEGDVLWDTTYGGIYTEFSPEINLAPDGHLGIAFNFLQSEKSDSRAIKYIKLNRFTAEVMTDVSILDFTEGSVLTKPLYDAYGNVILAGRHKPEFDLLGLVIKFNPETGDIIWSREYTRNGDLQHYIYDIQPTDDEGFVFCGTGYPEDHAGGFNQGWITTIDCKGADSLTYYFPEESCEDYTSVNDYPAAKESELLVYPNPASELITIKLDNVKAKTIRVTNTLGQIVFEQNDGNLIVEPLNIKVRDWAKGAYSIYILKTNDEVVRKTLLVNAQ
tara:strand:- start:43497 stop:44999 length:1503 start_codon:yes stop_codon:yes gene_type:complete